MTALTVAALALPCACSQNDNTVAATKSATNATDTDSTGVVSGPGSVCQSAKDYAAFGQV